MRTTPRQFGLLVGGCLTLATGVALLLRADMGSDGYSTLLNGLTISSGWPFWVVSGLVGAALVAMAWARKVRPGIGTLGQIVIVGVTVSVLLEVIPRPEPLAGRIVMLLLAMPVLAVGVAGYLGSQTGAGPTEGAALAWDPPVPFRWSYSLVQGGGALGGWLLGATLGVGTVAVIVLLGPLIDLAGRLLRLDLHQD